MLQTRSAAGALARSAAGAQRRRRVDLSRKQLVARAKRGSRALTRRGECQVFLCELPVGSEHAASRAKQQATVKYIYIYTYIIVFNCQNPVGGGRPPLIFEIGLAFLGAQSTLAN